MADKTYRQLKQKVLGKNYDINKNPKKHKKMSLIEIESDIESGKLTLAQAKSNLERQIDFSTFGDDFTTVTNKLSSSLSGWQDRETMNDNRISVNSMRDRIGAYESYRKLFGDDSFTDLSEVHNSYGKALKNWSGLSNEYGRYKDAKQYTNITNIHNMSLKEIKKKMEGKNKIAYTSPEGQEVTWKSLYNSKKLQTEINKIRSDSNYKKYVAKGKSINPESVGSEETSYRVRNRKAKKTTVKSNDRYAAEALQAYLKGESFENDGYYSKDALFANMTDEEFNDVAYYIAKDQEDGGNRTSEYIEAIRESLNQRRGLEIAEQVDDTWRQGAFALTAGLDQFTTGWVNAFSESDYIPVNQIQYASGKIRQDIYEDNGKLAQVGYDFANTTANMLPSVLMSSFSNAVIPGSGAVIGAGMMGASASGHAYQEMVNLGYDQKQARTYQTLIGVSEGALQYALGGIGKLGGTSGTIAKAVSQVDNGLARFAIRFGGSMASEGFEEAAQEVLAPIFMDIAAGGDSGAEIDWGEVAYSGLLGALSGGVMEGPSLATSMYRENQFNRTTGQNIRDNGMIGDVFGIASNPEMKSAYEAYNRYAKKGITAENVEDAQLGRLWQMAKADTESIAKNKKSNTKQVLMAKEDYAKLDDFARPNPEAQIKRTVNDEISKDADSTEALIEEGIASAEGSEAHKLATEYKAKVESGKKLTAEETAKLTKANALAIRTETVDKATERLKELGETKNVNEIANIIAKNELGEKITDEERKTLINSRHGVQVLNESNEGVVDYVRGMSSDEASLFVETYDGETDIEEYANSFNLVSEYARHPESFSQDYVLENKGVLTATQASNIYNGIIKADDNALKAYNKRVIAEARSGARGIINDSAINYGNDYAKGKVNWNSLSERQKMGVTFAKGLYEALGSNVTFVGKHKEFNGAYSTSKDMTYIDVYAGINLESGKGKDLIVPTIAHELTHEMEVKSPDAFKTLSNIVLNSLAESTGKSRVDIIAEEIDRLDRVHPEEGSHTEADAVSEIVARGCEDLLAESKEAKKMFNSLSESEQKTLVEKVKDIIKKVVDWIDKFLGEYKYNSQSKEAQELRKMKETYQAMSIMWDKMLLDVQKVNKSMEMSADEKVDTSKPFLAQPDEGMKFMTRSVDGNSVVWIEENILKNNNGKPEHQFIADFIAEHIGDVYTIIESGQKVYIGEDLPNEYTQSKYTTTVLHYNPNIIKAKKKAVANIGEIIEIATNRRWEKTKHSKKKDAKYGMYRYDTLFGFPVKDSKGNVVRANIYKAELVIRNASDGRKYLYDIVDIKKDTVLSEWMSNKTSSAASKSAGQNNDISNDSISNSDPNVKTKFSDRDSTGRKLSEGQMEYFKDSKVRDENGNVIPLSERFNAKNEDIRRSDRTDTTVYDLMGERDRLQKENEKFKADVERLKERLKLEKQITKGNYFNENQLGAVAGHLRKISDSNINKVELMRKLRDAYSFIAHTEQLTWEDVFERCYNIADEMVKEAKPIKMVDDYSKGILADIRKTRISLSESQKNEAQYRFGKNWNRHFFGRVVITDAGTPIDTMWQEWAGKYPDIFSEDVSDADMLADLYDIIGSLQESSETIMEYESEEQKRWLANEIYNQYWNVSPIKTTADKYDKKIKLLNFEHRRAMKETRDAYEARLADQKAADRRMYTTLANQLREQRDRDVARARELGQKRLDFFKENAERKTVMQSMVSTAMSLNRKLMTNSKDVHIPETLKPVVTSLLNSIDFSSKQLLGMKGTNIDKRGVPSKSDIATENALSKAHSLADDKTSLRKAMQNALELFENAEKVLHQSSDGLVDSSVVALNVDAIEDIKRAISNLDALESKGDSRFILQKMSTQDIRTLNDMVKSINHWAIVADNALANKHKKRISDLSLQTVEENNELGERQEYIKGIETFKNFFNWSNLLPVNAFKRLGNAATEFFDGLRDAQDKVTFNRQEVMDFMDGLLKKYKAYKPKSWRTEIKTFNLKLPNGENKTVKMPVSYIMSLYCVSKQEDAKRHLYGIDKDGKKLTYKDKKGNTHEGGGITLKGFKDGKFTLKVAKDLTNTVIDEKIVKQITGVLTDNQKAFADELQKYMNTTGSEWGDTVSMALYGIKKFGIEDYFPITVSPHTLNSDKTRDEKASLFSILNYGFTKERNPNASQSIEVGDIFDIFANHMNMVAIYNAYALPVYDIARWYNFKGKSDKGHEFSVTQSIEKAFGSGATTYVSNLIKDLNGQHESSRLGFIDKVFKNTKVAMVGNSLSVTMLQPTAYLKAMTKIPPKYLLKSALYIRDFGAKKGVEKAKKYCGIALLKSQGYFETGVSSSATTKMIHDESWKDKVVEWSLKGAEFMDERTWGVLWNACEFEVRAKRKDLKVGSKEFYEAIGKKLSDVIYETQVVDSPLTKSDLMRSPDTGAKMVTMFSSEMTVAYNMLFESVYDTHLDIKRMGRNKALKKNSKNLFMTLTAYTLTSAVTSIFTTAIQNFRAGDDDEEKTLDDYIKETTSNFFADWLIIGKIPYFKDAVSFSQGFSSSRTDTLWLESAFKAYEYWGKISEYEDKANELENKPIEGRVTDYKKEQREKAITNANKKVEQTKERAMKETLKSISYISGIAVYNQIRDLMATIDLFDD